MSCEPGGHRPPPEFAGGGCQNCKKLERQLAAVESERVKAGNVALRRKVRINELEREVEGLRRALRTAHRNR